MPELDVWRMDIDQPPPGTTAALSDWLIGEMAGFLARGSSGGSRLKTHDTQALRDNPAPGAAGRPFVSCERFFSLAQPFSTSLKRLLRQIGTLGRKGGTAIRAPLARAL